MIPKCCEKSSTDPQGNPDPGPGFVADGTSKLQVKESKKKQHLKACDGDKKEPIYLNVKHRTAKEQRRQRAEGNRDTRNKGFPVLSTTCWIIAVVLGILFLALLGITAYFITKGCPCPCCPEQWVTYRGRCYSFSKEKNNWNSSQESCRAQGAHLLVISDTSESDFFQVLHTIFHWIGLQKDTDGDWTWEDGSKLSNEKVKSNAPVQSCAGLYSGAIHASSCEISAAWICEKSAQ
ncbi:killer cell lectin-like receptor subfamily G member 1 [Sylvia atricapilla]|uniref:killer cell lectin-like receptor subfamily G member 1 n=1 Tax=Sylvia atricapilla TaxID=48155 RepID=UPI003397390D